MAKDFSGKGISTGKRWRNRHDNNQYFIIKNNVFLYSKILPKGMHQNARIEFQKRIFFSFCGGTSPLDIPFCLFNGKRFIIVLAMASKIGKVGGIDMRIANMSLEMINAFFEDSQEGTYPPSDTTPGH